MRPGAIVRGVMALATLVACEVRTVDTPIPAARGTIRDRAGRVLAIDTPDGRAYPLDRIAEHVIGDVTRGPSGVVGLSGVEAAWDDTLRGRAGAQRAPVDAPARATPIAAPIDGADVTLTIDAALTSIIARAFRGFPDGAVVVVDVRDGSVLALFSAPSFDRATLSREEALVDRTIGRALPPGGTIKPFTILAGLESGAISATERLECDLHSGLCSHFHGVLDAREAIAASCGSFAASVADRVGLAGISEVASDFGLGASTNVGLRFEVAGHLADPSRTDVSSRRRTTDAAVGSDVVAVTPLQLALAYAAIANGGTLWRPRLTTDQAPRARRRVHASPEHLALVRDGLERTLGEENGSAYGEGSDRVRIAGKTGHGHATEGDAVVATWFAGYAPAQDPTIAIVVVMDGSRGVRPVRVAAAIVERYLAPAE